MSFKSVLLGSSAHKNYTHNMSFDNNTTMEFGVLQPLLSQYMEPNSTIRVNSRQLVRLAPMPTPSFARMYLQNYARFVKMSDVVPYHECLLAKRPYYSENGVFTPVSMPFTSNSVLMYAILLNASFTPYSYNAKTQEYAPYRISHDDTTFQLFFLRYFSPLATEVPSEKGLAIDLQRSTTYGDSTSVKASINPTNSDYTLFFTDFESHIQFMVCFKFDAAGKRLRKQLVGLGYGLMSKDNHQLSLAPILAYYKAYFDTFGLTRDIPFETTNCFRLIKDIEDYNIDYSTQNFIKFPVHFKHFFAFLSDLRDTFFTDSDSYIAAHRANITNNVPERHLSLVGTPNDVGSAAGSLPAVSNSTPIFHNISLEALKRLSRFVSKDSVIGNRISEWVKVHYGAAVSNSLFEDCFNINNWRTPIDIDDVFSTSDTANISNENKGEYLGAYAGKGIGFGKNGFTFKAPVHGFCFVLSCLVPQTNVFQGNDPTLYAIDLDTIPQPEYDALGYELTPRSVFISDNFIGLQNDTGFSSDSFGYVPRYTGFKVKKNVVNGDMYLGNLQTDLQPYYNDMIIEKNGYTTLELDSAVKDNWRVQVDKNSIPSASTSWQQYCRYPFMGFFNRLFYNSGYDGIGYISSNDDLNFVQDNFIVQTVFDVRLTNWLKPIKNSYDTVDEQDNSSVEVSSN